MRPDAAAAGAGEGVDRQHPAPMESVLLRGRLGHGREGASRTAKGCELWANTRTATGGQSLEG